MRPRALLVTACVLAVASLGCAARLPTPPTGPHVAEEPVVVPYPPPPGHAEIIPTQPPGLTTSVWIDGEWQWRGRRWVWQRGQWEMPYPGAYYAPPTTVALSDGTIAWFAGHWHQPPKSATP